MTIALTANELIVVHQNQPRTTSTKVADAFGKLHKNVVQKIESLDCSASFASANFSAHDQEVAIGNGAKRKSKVYEMTKDGFMFLVMGFTGKKAAQVKEAYINAFNEMAEKLYGKPAPSRRKQKTLPNGLSMEQQDAIKGLVKARVETLAPDRRAKAAITCWSALKSKFGCTYKEIEPERFTDAVSLVARVPLEGDYLPAQNPGHDVLNGVNIHYVYGLVVHMEKLHCYWRELSPALKAMKSQWASRLHDHINDGAWIAGALRNDHAESFDAEDGFQQRMIC
ncbi:MAG: hypothetical protein COB05_18630 [Marinobacter sp.]|nr:MAG: hypothetical protein COB05_18630 [Marinobacter sp.]